MSLIRAGSPGRNRRRRSEAKPQDYNVEGGADAAPVVRRGRHRRERRRHPIDVPRPPRSARSREERPRLRGRSRIGPAVLPSGVPTTAGTAASDVQLVVTFESQIQIHREISEIARGSRWPIRLGLPCPALTPPRGWRLNHAIEAYTSRAAVPADACALYAADS